MTGQAQQFFEPSGGHPQALSGCGNVNRSNGTVLEMAGKEIITGESWQ